ncbi:hypothetical protein AMELA_G00207880 [Ameiurus melas]|uniref:Uncharacterized protein n=1 Tax=Ameiurus melas TaxID=219545 RepID=A0A7J6A3F7_AMEME|nr:hypothetical protein AMELA_G00207880 [Ameiurus melas]
MVAQQKEVNIFPTSRSLRKEKVKTLLSLTTLEVCQQVRLSLLSMTFLGNLRPMLSSVLQASQCVFPWSTPLLTRTMATLNQMHRQGKPSPPPKKLGATFGRPQMKAVVLKTMIRKPKKPNSANRTSQVLPPMENSAARAQNYQVSQLTIVKIRLVW